MTVSFVAQKDEKRNTQWNSAKDFHKRCRLTLFFSKMSQKGCLRNNVLQQIAERNKLSMCFVKKNFH